MKVLKNPNKREEYLRVQEKFNEEFKEFIDMEREFIINLTADEVQEMRSTMLKEIKELTEVKSKKKIEIILIVIVSSITVYSYGTPAFYVGIIFIFFLLIMLKRTINKIHILNYSILMFEDEFEIYYNNK